jgi:ABC-type dipeptide/oligopeptide/nickel transport system permease component
MLTFFLKRLMGLLPTLLIVAVLVFLFVHLLPGDPARLAAGQDADAQTVALVRTELGLDRPVPEQSVTSPTWRRAILAPRSGPAARWPPRSPSASCRPCC